MSDANDKKRLRLMPEVLPAPTRSDRDVGPRQRTLANMQRLLTLAAASAALGSACSREPGGKPVDPNGGASSSDNASGGVASAAASAGTPTSTSVATAAATATTKPTATATNPIPYGVVDPLPPPVRCPGIAESIKGTAKWKDATTIELHLPKPGRADAHLEIKAPPDAQAGTVIAARMDGSTLVVVFAPSAGSPQVTVQTACNDGTGHMIVRLDTSAPPKPGASVPVTLYDVGW